MTWVPNGANILSASAFHPFQGPGRLAFDSLAKDLRLPVHNQLTMVSAFII